MNNIEKLKFILEALEDSMHIGIDFLPERLSVARDHLRDLINVSETHTPVGEIYGLDIDGNEANPLVDWSPNASDLPEGTLLYTHQAPAAPVQELTQMNGKQPPAPWNTPAAQRQWVGLDEEEIKRAPHHIVDGAYHYSFKQGAKWADAKLREKNGGAA